MRSYSQFKKIKRKAEHMSSIEVVRNGQILEIMMNNPPANAINEEASRGLDQAFNLLRDDEDLRVAIVTGAGERFFTGGWDLKAVAAGDENEEDFGSGGFMGLTERYDLNKPVIVAVNGIAAGGGFEISLAADIVIAERHAQFILPETLRGFIPEAGGVIRAIRRLPRNLAIELLITGRRLSAEEGLQVGFVNHLVEQGEAMSKARGVAAAIMDSAPLAVGAVLEVVRATEGSPERDAFDIMRSGLPTFTRMRNSKDRDEGPKAFVEKRKPYWTGQ
jgi:crotonobetainyl-CoA hydratase